MSQFWLKCLYKSTLVCKINKNKKEGMLFMFSKKEFINNLIKELNDVNEDRIYYDKNPLDVCYLISVVDQQIEKCTDFINEIENKTYYINGYDEDTSGGYTNGKIRILIKRTNEDKENEYIYDTYENYCYYIEFLDDARHWGYCQCSPKDKDYNEKHKCCGMGCDWDAPAFKIIKELNMGYRKWVGYQKDYWEYKENFLKDKKNKNEEGEKFKIEQEKEYIRNQIEELQNKLKELDNAC